MCGEWFGLWVQARLLSRPSLAHPSFHSSFVLVRLVELSFVLGDTCPTHELTSALGTVSGPPLRGRGVSAPGSCWSMSGRSLASTTLTCTECSILRGACTEKRGEGILIRLGPRCQLGDGGTSSRSFFHLQPGRVGKGRSGYPLQQRGTTPPSRLPESLSRRTGISPCGPNCHQPARTNVLLQSLDPNVRGGLDMKQQYQHTGISCGLREGGGGAD
jgi:hypothetical protein